MRSTAARIPAWAWVSLIILAGLALRLIGYADSPHWLGNLDELAWTWQGQSLIADHRPSSWSYLTAYPHVGTMQVPGLSGTLPYVRDWMDHPPLFGLLVGGWAWLNGETTAQSVTPGVIRLVPIALSAATLALTFLVARRLFNPRVAFVALALLAVSPWAIQESRIVESEALLAPLLLLAVLCTLRYLAHGQRRDLLAVVLCCSLAPMVKVPGVLFGVAVALILAFNGRRRVGAVMLLTPLVGFGLFAAYGAALDWHQWVATTLGQAGRRQGPPVAGLVWLGAWQASLGDRIANLDPLWYLGLLSMIWLAWRRPFPLWWVLPLPVVLMVLFFSEVSWWREIRWNAGWYRIPVVPLVYIALGTVTARVRRHPPSASR